MRSLQQYYLQQMGIDVWVSRSHQTERVVKHEVSLMIMSEAVECYEDQRACKLLEQMLLSIGFSFQDVHFVNLPIKGLKNHRDLSQEDIQQCQKYLDQQIALVHPKVILAVGFLGELFRPHDSMTVSAMQQNRPLRKLAAELNYAKTRSAEPQCTLVHEDSSNESTKYFSFAVEFPKKSNVYWYQTTPVIMTYHPVDLLKKPTDKRKAFEDLLLIRQYV